jgi:primase-polymerase (primpol)-like protein
VKVVDVVPSLVAAPALLETAGLLATPLPPKVTRIETYSNPRIPTSEADYNYYLSRSASSGKAFDRSNADICYAMAMLRLGHLDHTIESRINDLSDKAKGRNDNYAEKTVSRARDFMAEDSQRNTGRQQVRL